MIVASFSPAPPLHFNFVEFFRSVFGQVLDTNCTMMIHEDLVGKVTRRHIPVLEERFNFHINIL